MLEVLGALPQKLIESIRKRSKIKLTPLLLFFLILFSSNVTAEPTVTPVWELLKYQQGDTAQFILNGNSNQTNISCMVRYYRVDSPLSNNTTIEAVKFILVPKLNTSGVGVFELLLVKENGFDELGGYNLTFRFGDDVIVDKNETYTAPRIYHHIVVEMSEQYFLEENDKDNEESKELIAGIARDTDNFKAWAIILFLTVVFILGYLIFYLYWLLMSNEGLTETVIGYLRLFYSKLKTPHGVFDKIESSDNLKELKRNFLKALTPSLSSVRKKELATEKKLSLIKQRRELLEGEYNLIDKDLEKNYPKDPMVLIVKGWGRKDFSILKGELANPVPSAIVPAPSNPSRKGRKLRRKKKVVENGR